MTGVTSVTFGEGVTYIFGYGYSEGAPFHGCGGIAEMTFKGLEVPYLSPQGQLAELAALETIYVPHESFAAYVAAYSGSVGSGVVFSYDSARQPVRNLRAEGIYGGSVYLAWQPHASASIIKYVIERDGAIVGETEGHGFHDRGLAAGQRHAYRVYGVTAEGAQTGAATCSAAAAAPKVGAIRAANAQGVITDRHNTIFIDTPNTGNHVPVNGWQIEGLLYYICPSSQARVLIGGAAVRSVTGSTVTYAVDWDIAGMEEGEYGLVFALTDVDGATAEGTGRPR